MRVWWHLEAYHKKRQLDDDSGDDSSGGGGGAHDGRIIDAGNKVSSVIKGLCNGARV